MAQVGGLHPAQEARPQQGAGRVNATTREEVKAERPRLEFLDGMRALAALAVTVFHAFQMYGLGLNFLMDVRPNGGLSTSLIDQIIYQLFDKVVQWGMFAVEAFIVISGYSLMLPVVRSAGGRIAGGTVMFFRRRARRILPPYYVALGLSLLLVALVPGLHTRSYVFWDYAIPALEPGAIFSHLLLVHNFGEAWFFKINPPMWSIAVEWQIYFLFPLLVLIWRRWNSLAAFLVALAFGVLPLFLLPITFPFSQSWFVGLFTLGMVSASISYSRRPGEVALRERLPWGWIALALMAGFGVSLLAGLFFNTRHATEWIEDTLLGAGVGAAMICFARADKASRGRTPILLRLLQSRPLVRVGQFAYSLYLVHAPILALVTLGCRSLGIPVNVSYGILVLFGVPLAVSLAYLFYLGFEKPFLSKPAAARSAQPLPASVA